MKTKNSKLREIICKWVFKKISEGLIIKRPNWNELGYQSFAKMLKAIKHNDEDLVWAFTELLTWGFDHDFLTEIKVHGVKPEIIVGERWLSDDVYKLEDRYFTLLAEDGNYNFKFIELELKPVTIKAFVIKDKE